MTSAPAIGFDYAPSRLLRRALLAVAALAVFSTLLCALPLWLRLILAMLVCVTTWAACRRLAAPAVVAAGWSGESDWTLRMTDSEDVPASLVAFRVLGAFVLLRLRASRRGTCVLLLAPDNSDADIRRRLRMRLATMQPGEALPRQ